MNKKALHVAIYALCLTFILAACGGADNNNTNNNNDNEEVNQELGANNGGNNENNNANNEEPGNASNNENVPEPGDNNSLGEDNNQDDNTSTGTAPSQIEDSIEFTRFMWIFGAPDRKPNAGVWLYTEDDHPSNKADTFDFEEHDYLLYQVSDEEYLGWQFRAQRIYIDDNDTARVVVAVHREVDEDEDQEGLEMPRQYLKVEKGTLRDKSFIVEMQGGQELSLE